MTQRLELYGRHQFGIDSSGLMGIDIYERCIAPFRPLAEADATGFLNDLRALTADDQGGFVSFGAAQLVWELFDRQGYELPEALPIIDAGLRFKRDRNLPTAMFTGLATHRLAELREQEG